MARIVFTALVAGVVLLAAAFVILGSLAVGPAPQLVEKTLPNRALSSR